MRHDWYRDCHGDVDMSALDVDPNEFSGIGHNGPICRRCGGSFCEHCVRGMGPGAVERKLDEPCEGDE